MAGFLTSYRAWDEKKVVAWLHSIKCGQYESLFRGNFHFDPQSNLDAC
jgi:mitogen-activated protein kinase kinase kinase